MPRKKIEEKLQELTKVVCDLESMIFEGCVQWVDCENWPVGESRNIGGTTSTKLLDKKNLMVFRTFIPDAFPHHYHDFDEFNIVLNGQYDDGIKKYEQGETIHYKPGEWHAVRSVGEKQLEIIVIFYRE